MHLRVAIPVALLLSITTPAHAKDRLERAHAIFTSSCGTCHSIDHGGRRQMDRGRINLADVKQTWSEAQLRAWVKGPAKVKKDATCAAAEADPVQIDLLVGLLMTRRPQAIVIPPFTPGPPLPADKHPRAGQGDHR